MPHKGGTDQPVECQGPQFNTEGGQYELVPVAVALPSVRQAAITGIAARTGETYGNAEQHPGDWQGRFEESCAHHHPLAPTPPVRFLLADVHQKALDELVAGLELSALRKREAYLV